MKKFFTLLLFSLINHLYAQPPGNSLNIQNTGDYVQVNDLTSTTVFASMTIEAWVYVCCNASSPTLVSKGWCNSNYGYYIIIVNGKLEFVWQLPSISNCTFVSSYQSIASVIPVNAWTHVGVVYTATSVTLYVNGIVVPGALIQGSYGAIKPTAEPIRIGGYRRAAGDVVLPFLGRIDEFRIYNVARTAAQIQSDFTISLIGNESGLQLYYKLDELGTGPGIPVINSAIATAGMYTGTTVGATIQFLNNTIPTVCFTGPPPSGCTGLPLILNDFYVSKQNNSALLTWKVENLYNVKGFQVQKSLDGQSFSDAQYIPATNQKNYNHIDQSLFDYRCYYRLKIIDNDGSFYFSPVRLLLNTTKNAAIIYPSPAHNEINIAVSNSCNYFIQIFDHFGKLTYTAVEPKSNKKIDVSQWPAGIYSARILFGSNEVMTKKIIIAH